MTKKIDAEREEARNELLATEKTLEELAREYVELLNSPPNAWGQHVHPTYGQSHAMLNVMIKAFGDLETFAAIHEAERGE